MAVLIAYVASGTPNFSQTRNDSFLGSSGVEVGVVTEQGMSLLLGSYSHTARVTCYLYSSWGGVVHTTSTQTQDVELESLVPFEISWDFAGEALDMTQDPYRRVYVHTDYSWVPPESSQLALNMYDGAMLVVNGEVVSEESGPSKPTTPTPADDSGPGINFATRTLSWVNGGGATSYTVRIGPYPIAYNVVSEDQVGTSYVIPENAIALYKDNPVTWRVDANNGEATAIGDTWTFDPRPAAVTTPSPVDGAESQSLNLETLLWAASTYADSYTVYPSWGGGSGFASADASLSLTPLIPLYLDRLDYGESYTWHVTANNAWGETDSDTWGFDTWASLMSPVCSWVNYSGKTLGPGDANGGGVEGTDFYYTGDNCVIAQRILLAFAQDKVWYAQL